MTNPSDISTDNAPFGYTCHAHAGSGIQTISISSERAYSIAHDSLSAAGGSDTNTIYVATSGNPINVADPQFDCKQVRLTNGRSLVIGPGLTVFRFASAAGAPTFALVPSERFYRV